jgi:hypothetical protein
MLKCDYIPDHNHDSVELDFWLTMHDALDKHHSIVFEMHEGVTGTTQMQPRGKIERKKIPKDQSQRDPSECLPFSSMLSQNNTQTLQVAVERTLVDNKATTTQRPLRRQRDSIG